MQYLVKEALNFNSAEYMTENLALNAALKSAVL
jgi:hypothetical protein